MRTQKPLDSVGWLGGANNRFVVHKGAKAVSTLRTCPKCQRKSLGGGPAWGRVWCLYAAEGACGYSAPLDLDSDVDDKQMTHSDEPADAEERRLWRDMAEKADTWRLNNFNVLRLIADVEAGERHLQSLKDDAGDMLCDLEDQVKRLEVEAQRIDFMWQGEVGWMREAHDKLETENKRLRELTKRYNEWRKR